MAPHPDYTTPSILPDNPLRGTQDAEFHFHEFAVTLARLIADKDTDTPLSIGVSGSWGTGKTTLLRRLKAQLDETRQILNRTEKVDLPFGNFSSENHEEKFRVCRTVWFNAWKYQNEEQLLVALVRVIVQEMFRDEFISKLGAAFWEPFTPRRDVIDTVLGWASIKTPFGEVKAGTGKKEPTKLAEKTAVLDLFDDAFDHLMAAWVHHQPDSHKIDPKQGVLVVFIDDLDRCLPAKAIQVLEAVKLFMDKEGCVFVLGADGEFIQRAVSVHYKDIEEQKAEDYLEKVIQLRFQLPQIAKEEMQAYLDRQNDKVHPDMRSRWQALVAAAEANPRRVKAVVNDLELQWRILENTQQADKVNRDDFICWQALMRAAPLGFRDEFYGIPEDEGGLKLRHQFIQAALKWMCGSAEEQAGVRADFEKYAGKESRRLRDVLREIKTFSADLTPASLNAYVHLAAPPRAVLVSTAPLETQAAVEFVSAGKGNLREGVSEAGREVGGLRFCAIPAGDFVMGSTADNALAAEDEKPRHTVFISSEYWLARFPVTNAQFQAFAQANPEFRTTAEEQDSAYTYTGKEWTNVKGADWRHPRGPKSSLESKDEYPVVCVSWGDANAYCRWLNLAYGKQLPAGWKFRLPTEAEWERAARDPRGSAEWPWGSLDPDETLCNFGMKVGDTNPVGRYSPLGDSPYGCVDMAGNVWEWTHTAYQGYPYSAEDGREKQDSSGARVMRGGSFGNSLRSVRCAYRYGDSPMSRGSNVGFRVVASPITFDL